MSQTRAECSLFFFESPFNVFRVLSLFSYSSNTMADEVRGFLTKKQTCGLCGH